ncbi:hypothetical protein [Rhodospirillum rubrum]|uniref:Helix-turn-helix protein, CopG n=1 Tax=Rhodospirillum rubrum (strain ATCC 11170 / ATH 1.1.1 / DSM 467 / LMG 4362 / NCIMB 8255 / S1) TaxID=269796 RepID=Q2RVR7_RHORT|nr:hypothetical protein [Rhodospirillum rubrum]ABC21778.1 hypothetical protein Rru_A0977 [Rhodospirillum rubrum ATCC 11170]AEO47478.1 hypothetical protein F11_05040 [Rhodospirillum rubrum F11]MBK5953336.1 hypothetical protein [Rhodospirillum rubrum]QXG81442.1 hypothetical protein KUL73_05100 [Rhodospirillum rubrum]
MPHTTQNPKEGSFNFRLDPALKSAFTRATAAEDKSASQVLRDFMRAYVAERQRGDFLAEAHQQSLAVAERARDRESDEARSLAELASLLDEDPFRDEGTA